MLFLLMTATDARSARVYPLGNRRVGEAAHPGPMTNLNPLDDADGDIWELDDADPDCDDRVADSPAARADMDVEDPPELVGDSDVDHAGYEDVPDSDDDSGSDADHPPVCFDAAWEVAERLLKARPPPAPAGGQTARPPPAPPGRHAICAEQEFYGPARGIRF